MEHFIEFIFFFLKTALIVVALLVVIAYIFANSMRAKLEEKNKLKLKNKTKEFKQRKQKLEQVLASDSKMAKTLKKTTKQELKKDKKIKKPQKRLFVLDFNGDLKASQTENLSQEITSLIQVAKKEDEVVLRLESPGGMVSGYGLAASELMRLKNSGLHLTICVDKVAASGGYMMACVGSQILAAPFAVIGSIGVVAQLPNFNKLLQKNNIDYEVLTAGDYKRTLTMFGENTSKGREKFVDQLEDIHKLFKDFIHQNRPQVELDKVATGEFWFGNQCQDLKLIDKVSTSEDYIFSKMPEHEIFELSTEKNKSLVEKITEPVSRIIGQRLSEMSLWNGI